MAPLNLPTHPTRDQWEQHSMSVNRPNPTLPPCGRGARVHACRVDIRVDVPPNSPPNSQLFNPFPLSLKSTHSPPWYNHRRGTYVINRANAQHSTGPKTEAGKQKSSLNALRHGLTGQIVVMPNEDLEAYQQLLKSFTDHLRPVGPLEATLVQALADCSWRLSRVAAMETNLVTLKLAETRNSRT
jgi:hypothetical protein